MGEGVQVLQISKEDFDHLPPLDQLIARAAVRLQKARIVDEGSDRDLGPRRPETWPRRREGVV